MRSLVGTLLNKAPVPYVGRGGGLAMPWRERSGAEAQMDAMGSSGTLFAIVNRTSNAVALVNWRLYRKSRSGLDEDRVEVTKHVALDLINKPNQFFTRQELFETSQQHVDLTGEGWWVIGRDPRSRMPLELWPVRPDRMTPVPSTTDYLAGYIYTGPEGEEVPLALDDVIFVRMPNPLDPYRGMGPVQTVLVDIGAEQAAAEWNRNFFANSAEPGGIVEIERRLSDTEFAEHLDRWREQHRGVANAHRVALLEGGMKWVDRKYTNRDMEFTSLRNMSSTKLREAFGMPKFAVGDVEDVNRATAEASKAWFAEQLTVPRLERWKGALNNDLLRLYNATDTLEFDYDNPVPPDAETENAERTSKTEAAALLVAAGWDPDEVLDTIGLPAMTFVGPPAAPAAVEAPAEEAPEEEPPVPGRRGRTSALLNAADDEGREDWEDRLDDLIDAWADVSEGHRNSLAEQITKVVDEGTPEGLADLHIDTAEGVDLLTEAMLAQAAAAGRRIADDAARQGVSISPVTPIAPTTDTLFVNAVKPSPAKYIAGLASDLKAIAKVGAAYLAGGYVASAAREAMRIWAPGSTGAEVAAGVVKHLEGLTDATLRSELGGAIWAAENEGRFATLEQAETDGKSAARYEASERRDTNTCKPCSQVDGKTFAKLSEVQAEYPCGGYRHCDGRARCRGTVEPIWY